MRFKKILLAVHPEFVPAGSKINLSGDGEVFRTLHRLGYQAEVVGVRKDLRVLDRELARYRPDIVFNLLEEFRNEAIFDFHLVSYLEALGIPYTGCNPRGLIMSRNKFLVGQLAAGLGMLVPKTAIVGPRSLKIPELPADFPWFLKLNREHASLGIRESNRVHNVRDLQKVWTRMRRDYSCEILVQEFVPGTDVSVSLWGNRRAETLPPRQLRMGGSQRILTERLKFDVAHQRRRTLRSRAFGRPVATRIRAEAKRLYGLLDLSGYARFDFRVTSQQVPYLIDVNANPNLAINEDFMLSARSDGWTLSEIFSRIIRLGENYRPNI